MEALIGFVAVIGVIGYLTLMVWFVVIAVRFLRSGRKAFDRYIKLTDPRQDSPGHHERLPRTGSGTVASPPPAPPAVRW